MVDGCLKMTYGYETPPDEAPNEGTQAGPSKRKRGNKEGSDTELPPNKKLKGKTKAINLLPWRSIVSGSILTTLSTTAETHTLKVHRDLKLPNMLLGYEHAADRDNLREKPAFPWVSDMKYLELSF